ncbi:hypothetical protein C3L33_09930, partial [Rhododendron williamsianum]
MLSLFEATHLRVHGEDILDEALTFTTTHLNSALPNLSKNPLEAQVVHALNQPIHKGLTRLEARCYFLFYEQDDSHNKTILDFAKLDFNLLQKLYQRELGEITRWWKDLDFANKLPFSRDRVVECYFWMMGVCFEPQYYFARKLLTKVITLASIMDDIYDIYGTLEELVLFTDAIERWEMRALDQLPAYMKLFYQALLDVYNEIDDEMAKEGKSYATEYAKSAYMSVALNSSGYKMLATTSFVGMAELATKEAFEWVSSDPLIVQAAAVIARLMDDMVSHKVEQQRGDAPSAVECYMKQHGVIEDEALVELQKLVTNAWKDINAACLHPVETPMPLLMRVLNLARAMDVLYKDEDNYTNPETKLKGYITSVIINPVQIN